MAHLLIRLPAYAQWRVYNIGNNNPVELKDYMAALEKALGKVISKELLPMQPGDVLSTYADVDDLVKEFDYKTSVLSHSLTPQ